MALLPYLIPSLIQAGGGLLGYATRPKRRPITPAFETTKYGGLLQKRAREGLYPPSVRGGILRGIGERTGSVAQQERARIRGGLVSRGMGESVAGLRVLGEPGRRRMGILGEAERGLMVESEMGKRQAEEELARLSTEFGMRRSAEEEQIRLEAKQAISDLVGGFAGAGMMGVTDWIERMDYNELMNIYKQLLGAGGEGEGAYRGGLIGGGVRRPLYQPATVQPFGTKRGIFQDYY